MPDGRTRIPNEAAPASPARPHAGAVSSSAKVRILEVSVPSARWTRREDEIFRKLVNSRASPSSIAQILNRTEDELKKRGYLLGLPLKWFKTSCGY